MPDISMCPSETCPKRMTCYRNEASGTKPCKWRQSYIAFDDDHDEPACEHYWPPPAGRAALSQKDEGR